MHAALVLGAAKRDRARAARRALPRAARDARDARGVRGRDVARRAPMRCRFTLLYGHADGRAARRRRRHRRVGHRDARGGARALPARHLLPRVNAITAGIVRRKLLLPYVGLPNVLAGRFVVPGAPAGRRDAREPRAGGAQPVRRHGDAARGSRRCSPGSRATLAADTGALAADAVAQELALRAPHERPSHRAAVAGIDEAGRGPLAGPVVAAAVILDPARPIRGLARLEGADARAARGAGGRDPRARDRLGRRARRRRRDRHDQHPARVDARDAARRRGARGAARGSAGRRQPLSGRWRAGCARSSRATATCRRSRRRRSSRRRRATRCCVELDREYPVYGFARHKGYATPEHLAALALHGPCPGAPAELRAGRAAVARLGLRGSASAGRFPGQARFRRAAQSVVLVPRRVDARDAPLDRLAGEAQCDAADHQQRRAARHAEQRGASGVGDRRAQALARARDRDAERVLVQVVDRRRAARGTACSVRPGEARGRRA